MAYTASLILLAFAATLTILRVGYPLAARFGLLDQPGGRKVHSGRIPLIGGLAIYLAMWIVVAITPDTSQNVLILLACAGILVLVGAIDDRYDLPVLPRLAAQGTATVLMIELSGLYLHSPMPALGLVALDPALGKALTILAVVGLINAFNMIDGIDGLAGTLALISVLTLAIGQAFFGYFQATAQLLIFAAALTGYLAVNLCITTRKKVFLGDAGSLLIGFILAWALIGTTQGQQPSLPASFAIWAVALPAFDIISVMSRRIRKGQSPFRADRTHLHHICLRAGLEHRQALGVMILLSISLSIIGGLLTQFTNELTSVCAFLVLLTGYCYGQARIWKILVWIRKERLTSSKSR